MLVKHLHALSLAFALLILLPGSGALAQDDQQSDGPLLPGVAINERVMSVPGDPQRPVRLQVTVLTPPGPGPFPLVVANHGATEASNQSRGSRYRKTFFAFYFLSRGYAVALPMMRGFAGSGGDLEAFGCNVARVALDNAKDIRAVIEFMSIQPDIDASKVVVIGQSFGGWNTLALGADRPANVVGLINFVGGLRTSACDDADAGLISGAAEFGKRTTIPSIWFYGDNDSLFAPSLWRKMFQRYTAAGGKAELVAFGRFNTDSHQLASFPESLPIWTPHVDEFLGRIGMANQMIHPEYLPKPWPKPTGVGAIDDVQAVPYLNDAGRALYRTYLRRPMSKVFLISPDGFVRDQHGGFDPVQDGLNACRQAQQVCGVYAIDNDVVWTPLPKSPQPSHYAALDDVTAVPYLNDAGRDLYRRFLAKTGRRALVVTPGGGVFAHFGGADPFDTTLLLCQETHRNCQPYAIDDDVVWVRPTPVPPATNFAALQNVEAVPYLKPDGRRGYQAFLTATKPRAFVIAPDGAWFSGSGGLDPATGALAACNKRNHQDCGLYAVDDTVVWSSP